MWLWAAQLSYDDYLKGLALLGALVGFGVGLFQYSKAQQWKKAEFLAGEMKQFFANPRVHKALLLIDWDYCDMDLLDNVAGASHSGVTRQMQTMGLLPHVVPACACDSDTLVMGNEAFRRGFTQEEVLIRNCYDAFLDGLQRFSSYVQAGLIDASSLRPYIGYWLDCISSPAENAEDAGWRAALLSYVSFYQYSDVVWLLNAFGKDIRPSSRAYVCFLKQMSDQELASKLAETVGCKYPSNKEK